MFLWLGEQLFGVYGPFRLFTSYLFLAGVGTALSGLLTWWLLAAAYRLAGTIDGALSELGKAAALWERAGAAERAAGAALLAAEIAWQGRKVDETREQRGDRRSDLRERHLRQELTVDEQARGPVAHRR